MSHVDNMIQEKESSIRDLKLKLAEEQASLEYWKSLKPPQEPLPWEELLEAARKVVPGYLKKEKVDIKTLEEILKKEGSANVYINPDGSITASAEMEKLREILSRFPGGGDV